MVQELITPLVRSLGPSHARLLMSLRAFPRGADGLLLRVLKIFTDNGRPSAPLVALVKSLIAERELDVRFLVPIIAELDKVWKSLSGTIRCHKLMTGTGGNHQTYPTRRRYTGWYCRKEGSCPFGVRQCCSNTSADFWCCDIKSTTNEAKRSAFASGADGASA
jgi:hypothetical protein